MNSPVKTTMRLPKHYDTPGNCVMREYLLEEEKRARIRIYNSNQCSFLNFCIKCLMLESSILVQCNPVLVKQSCFNLESEAQTNACMIFMSVKPILILWGVSTRNYVYFYMAFF